MEFTDDAFVLSARAHGESGAIVDLFTARHGRYAAHVAGELPFQAENTEPEAWVGKLAAEAARFRKR